MDRHAAREPRPARRGALGRPGPRPALVEACCALSNTVGCATFLDGTATLPAIGAYPLTRLTVTITPVGTTEDPERSVSLRDDFGESAVGLTPESPSPGAGFDLRIDVRDLGADRPLEAPHVRFRLGLGARRQTTGPDADLLWIAGDGFSSMEASRRGQAITGAGTATEPWSVAAAGRGKACLLDLTITRASAFTIAYRNGDGPDVAQGIRIGDIRLCR